MSRRTPPRRPSDSRLAVAAAVAATSIAVHAILLATIELNPGSGAVRDLARDDLTSAAVVPDGCATDAALALAARAAVCATPWSGGDRQACARRAADDFQLELILCEDSAEDLEADAIAFLDLDEVTIEPAPLVDVVPREAIEAARLVEPEPVPEEVEKAKKEIESPKAAGQIVEITRPEVEVRPDAARFLSEFDSQTEKETVARGSTEEMVARPQPRELPVAPEPRELPDDAAARPLDVPPDAPDADADGAGEAADRPPSLLAMRGEGTSDRSAQDATRRGEGGDPMETSSELGADGFLPRPGTGARDREALRDELGGGGEAGGAAAGKRVMPNLRPSEELLARTVGGGSVDKLDGVESGDFTALNSKKWKYAPFFNRMKRQVAQNWHPDRVYLRRDPTGKIYGRKDRVTVLQVSLNPNGSLSKVIIEKQSGVDFLDDEAVRAFQMAQPFPNPPSGLVDQDNLITFSFGFHFQIGGSQSDWRIFRYQ